MKKTLAILLTLILTFSSVSVLGTVSAEETPTTNVVFTDFTDFSDTSIWGGSNVKIVDENSDGVKDFIRLDTTANKKTAYIASKTFTLVPGTEYEISCYVRVPSTSAIQNDGTIKQAPRFIIYQTDAEENGKPTISYGEGKHDYAYKGKGTEDNILRRKDFKSYWTIGDSAPINRPAYSSCSDTMFYSAYPDKTPNEVFEDWTKVTATFTAIDDENNIGPETVSFRIDLKKSFIANAQLDIKNLTLIDKSIVVPEVLPEGVILDEDFEELEDATTVIKDGSNANWEKIEVTDSEAANGTKSASIFAPYVKLYIPLNKSLLKANTEYKFSMNWKMLEYNADTAKNTLKNLRLAGWNTSEGQACKDATKLAGASNTNATGQWINATFNFTISDLEAYEEFIISFDYTATPTDGDYVAPEDSIFIDDIKVIDTTVGAEPEEPETPEEPEVEAMDFEDVTKWRGNGYKSTQLAGYTGHVVPESYTKISANDNANYILDGDSSVRLEVNSRWYDFPLTGLKSNTKYALKFSYLTKEEVGDKKIISVYGIFNYGATGASLTNSSIKNSLGYLNYVSTTGYAIMDNNGEGTSDYYKSKVRANTAVKEETNHWYTGTLYFNTTEVTDTLAFVLNISYNNVYLDRIQLVEVDYTTPAQDATAPVVSGKTQKGPFETENTMSYLYEGCNADDYDAYLQTLVTDGYTLFATNEYDGGNKFATYTKGNTTVNVTYTPNNSTILVSQNATDTLPTTKEQNVYEDKGLQPLIIQLDHNNKTNGGIGMSYIIRLADGSFILVDGGHTETQFDNANRLYDLLRQYTPEGKIQIASWFITHCHSDHIGAFVSFVEYYSNEVNIEQVVYNTATYEQFKANAAHHPNTATQQEPILPSYINQDVFTATIALLKLNGTKISTCHSGYEYNIRNAVVNVMFTLEDVFPSVFGVTNWNANNTSTILKFSFTDENVDQTFLITGDTSTYEGEAIYKKYVGTNALKADIMQIIHHGGSYGSKPVYELIEPTVALLPIGLNRYLSVIDDACNAYFFETDTVKEVVVSDYGTRTFALPYTAPEGLTGSAKFTIPDDIENVNTLEYVHGVSIRKAGENGTEAKQALRFKFGVNEQVIAAQTVSGYKVAEYGAMVSESATALNYYAGNKSFVRENDVATFKAVSYNKAEGKNIVFSETTYGDYKMLNFTCALKNIGVDKYGNTDYTKYDTNYYVRAYIVFENAEGDTKIYYGATQSASIFATMLTILKDNSNADDVAYVNSFINGQVAGFEADADAIKAAWNSSTDRKNYYVQ